MVDGTAGYLTVSEVADRLRVAPQTVYRWCRAGRLVATKIGKEWRIPTDQVATGSEPEGTMLLAPLLEAVMGLREHLVGLAADRPALARMEETFYKVAAAQGGRLLYGLWEGDAPTVRARLQPAIGAGRERQRALHVLEVRKAYEKEQGEGPRRLLSGELDRAGRQGLTSFLYGSCYAYFGYNFARLVGLEGLADEALRGRPALALCGYALNDLLTLYGARALSLLMDLMEHHSGTVWFDGERAVLSRPVGRRR